MVKCGFTVYLIKFNISFVFEFFFVLPGFRAGADPKHCCYSFLSFYVEHQKLTEPEMHSVAAPVPTNDASGSATRILILL
jgi:hypothetical protein